MPVFIIFQIHYKQIQTLHKKKMLYGHSDLVPGYESQAHLSLRK